MAPRCGARRIPASCSGSTPRTSSRKWSAPTASCTPRAPRGSGPPDVARAPGLDRLWAPWRMAYVARATEPAGCLFCRVRGARGADRRHLVLSRGPLAFVMLNRFPYNPGHLMVAVARHVANFADLTPAERDALLSAVALAERALAAEYRPQD